MDNNDHPRTLHLVDIENLTGLPRPTAADVAACYDWYRALIRDDDLVVVAFNHGAFAAVAWEWPAARLLVRSGPDGADKALMDVIIHERVQERFHAVTVASGDGIFSDSVALLGGSGVAVAVVSRPDALARKLRMAAASVISFAPASAAGHAAGLA